MSGQAELTKLTLILALLVDVKVASQLDDGGGGCVDGDGGRQQCRNTSSLRQHDLSDSLLLALV